MKDEEKKLVPTSIRIPSDTMRKVEHIAEVERRSLANVINVLLELALEDYEPVPIMSRRKKKK